MRKTLLPMLVSLALCGAAIAAVIATNARAQGTRKPVMVATLMTPSPLQMAANTLPSPDGAGRDLHMPPPAMLEAHRKEICADLYARAAGQIAYTEARLQLTAAQQPLFDRWKTVRLDLARHHAGFCSDHHHERATHPLNIVDRMARHEERLKKRLTDLDSERPALEALFAALSPQQKAQFGFDGHSGPMGGHMFHAGMRERMGHPFQMDAPPPDARPSR